MPLQSWGALIEEAGDNAEEFSVLPQADYDLQIVKSEAKMTKTGKVMFAVQCKVTSGPYANRRVFTNIVVSPENPTALGIFFRQMAAIGISREFFANNPSDSQVAEAMVNREFRGQVGIRAYQGQDKNEIKSFSRISKSENAGPAGPPAPMTAAPSPTNAPPAQAAPSPAPAPATPPPAAAAAPAQAAPAAEPAPAPVTQAATPPVADTVAPAPAPQADPAPAIPTSAPSDPF